MSGHLILMNIVLLKYLDFQLIGLVLLVLAGRGGRKLDEVREKYQKACRKLHLTHNEYVLLLGAVTECEHDLRTNYLPSLLQRQQIIHQEFIVAW